MTRPPSTPRLQQSLLQRVLSLRFFILLLALLFLLVLPSSTSGLSDGAQDRIGPFLVAGVFTFMLLAAVLAVSRRPSTMIVGIVLAVALIVLQFFKFALGHQGLMVAHHALAASFLGYSTFLSIIYLFTTKGVTTQMILASLSIYLMLGLLWAFVYAMLEILAPGSFHWSENAIRDSGVSIYNPEQLGYWLYFSYVTLTTLGYGDTYPLTEVARLLCSLEAITGQLYVAVLVARLVGLHVAQGQGPEL